MQSIYAILDIKKVADSRLKSADVSRTQEMCHVMICYLDVLQVRYNCDKFYHCRINVADFREGEPFWPPHP